jgi:hypothetical protein
LGGLPDTDLVAVGTFDRIRGTDAGGGLATEAISSVSIWRDVAAADPIYPMYGGSIWRNGGHDLAGWQAGPAAAKGHGLVAGSLDCYPSPLTEGPLHVSGRLRSAGRVRAAVYNLEGELIRQVGWREAGAVDPFVIEVALPGAATGMYLCRLSVEIPGGGTEHGVTRFAIVR